MRLAADLPAAAAVAAAGHELTDLGRAEAVVLCGPDGWSRARRVRAEGSGATLVVHGAGPSPPDRAALEPVVVLRTGPDGVVGADALAAALLRCGSALSSPLPLAGGALDVVARQFLAEDGARRPLSPLETRLLAYLAARGRRGADRAELQEEVWDHVVAVDTKAVDVAIARLRRKIERDPTNPTTLLTEPGGYRVALRVAAAAPVDEDDARALVGRAELLAEIGRHARRRGAHTVVIGPPGVGKSRLVAEVVRGLVREDRAVWCVDVDHVPPGGGTGVGLATALDLEVPEGAEPLTAVLDRVGAGVLVLDHCERLPELLAEVLAAAAGRCAVLAASQLAPTVPGTGLVVIPPLPDADAAELLVRAAGGTLGRADAAHLAPLLDGLPLALLLAGARIGLLGPAAFEQALGARLRLLSAPGADRHRSLDLAVADAVSRLPPVHRDALHGLAAMRGAFDLDDAVVLLGDEAPFWVSELVSHGVVARDSGRFRLLHAIRDHVVATAGPPSAASQVAWGRHVASTRVPRLSGAEARTAFAELAERQAELRAAALAALSVGDLRSAAIVADAVDRVLVVPGTEAERARWRDRIEPAVAGDRGSAGRMRFRRADATSDVRRAHLLAVEAAELLRDIDPDLAARASFVAFVNHYRRDPPDTLHHLLRHDPAALTRATRAGLAGRIALCRHATGELTQAALVAELGAAVEELAALDDLLDAVELGLMLAAHARNAAPASVVPLLGRLVSWAEPLRHPGLLARLYGQLATDRGLLGHRDEAERAFAEAEALLRRVRPAEVRLVSQRRAWLALQLGDLATARTLYEDVLASSRALGAVGVETEVLAHLALVEADAGRPGAARARAAEAEAACASAGRRDLRPYVTLAVALAAVLDHDPIAASSALRDLDPAALTPSSELSRLTLRVTIARALGADTAADEAALRRWLADDRLPDAAGRAHVTTLGLAGRSDELRELLASGQTRSVDHRLLARLWLT